MIRSLWSQFSLGRVTRMAARQREADAVQFKCDILKAHIEKTQGDLDRRLESLRVLRDDVDAQFAGITDGAAAQAREAMRRLMASDGVEIRIAVACFLSPRITKAEIRSECCGWGDTAIDRAIERMVRSGHITKHSINGTRRVGYRLAWWP